ncbi:MAG: hypothetical protein HQL54_03285 [Magnetococcales bacterium]|nr:hypothetical protein [Magnetococcales bacterium]
MDKNVVDHEMGCAMEELREMVKEDRFLDYKMVRDEAWRMGDHRLAVDIQIWLERSDELEERIIDWVADYQEGLEQQQQELQN